MRYETVLPPILPKCLFELIHFVFEIQVQAEIRAKKRASNALTNEDDSKRNKTACLDEEDSA